MQKAVVSCKRIFREGMGYVALSRVTSKNGLTLLDFDEKTIYASATLRTILKQKKLFCMPPHIFPILATDLQGKFKILFHNVNGLKHCIDDLRTNPEVLNVDVVAVGETKLCDTDSSEHFAIPGYSFIRHSFDIIE